MNKRKGFTTVELVIVIAVIAILATAVIPTIGGLIRKAKHSVDVQMARNLTAQVAMYSMEHKIEDEDDLAAAIDAGMGEGYYMNELMPESAQYGYCFWYDYVDCQVRVGTLEEIAAIRQERVAFSDKQALLSNARSGGTSGFAPGNLRGKLIQGFLLMARNGDNKLTNLIVNLENADIVSYTTVLGEIAAFPNDFEENSAAKNAAKEWAQAVLNTPIGNGGVLVSQAAIAAAKEAAANNTEDGMIDTLYLPLGNSLDQNVVHTGESPVDDIQDLLAPDFAVYVPKGSVIITDVLNLQRKGEEDDNNPFMDGSHEIHMNIEADELDDYFYTNATSAVIVLPSGRYVQNEDGTFSLLTSGGEQLVPGVETKIFGTLQRFGVSFVADDAEDGTTMVVLDGNILYVSADHKGTITLNAHTFEGIETPESTDLIAIPIRNISCKVGEDGVSSDGTKCTLSGLTDGSSVTVSSRDGVSYTYTVKVAKVNSFDIATIDSKASTNRTFDLAYRNKGDDKDIISWPIVSSLGFINKIDGITIDTTVSLKDDTLFTVKDNKLTATSTLLNGLKGDRTIILTFICSGVETDITVNLIDSTLAAFTPSSNTHNMKERGSSANKEFVVGTEGTLLLSSLFAAEDVSFNKVVLSITGAGAPIDLTKDNWASYDLAPTLKANITSETKLTLSLKSYGGVAMDLTIRVIPGAYNVASVADWEEVANNRPGVSIAVLAPITFEKVNVLDSSTAAAAVPYSVELGGAAIYGNLNPINVNNTFKVLNSSHNHLIHTTGGMLEHVIINGPSYEDKVSVTASVHGKMFHGTYVSAVLTAPNAEGKAVTIKDSYISGFREPLAVRSGGVATIDDTTFFGGNFANITVLSAPATLKLTNVTTIQPITGHAGVGIALSFDAKDGTKIEAKNLKQYNFLTAQQIYDYTLSAINILEGSTKILLVDDAGNESTLTPEYITNYMSDVQHGSYFHAGVFELGLKDLNVASYAGLNSAAGKPSFDNVNSTGLGYTQSVKIEDMHIRIKVKIFTWIQAAEGKFSVTSYGLAHSSDSQVSCLCGCTTNGTFPAGTADEFLAAR